MPDATVSTLILDAKQYLDTLKTLDTAYAQSKDQAVKFGSAVASIDKKGNVAALTLKTVTEAVGQLTTKLDVIRNKAGVVLDVKISNNLRQTAKDLESVTDKTRTLGIELSRLALGTKIKIQTDTTDALKNLLGKKKIDTGSEAEIINFRRFEEQFQKSFAKLNATSKLSEAEISNIFENIKLGKLQDIPRVAREAVSDFLKMRDALREIGIEAGKTSAQIKQATTSLLTRIDPRLQQRRQQAEQFTQGLATAGDQTIVGGKTDAEIKRLNAAVNDSIKFFKESDLTLRDFEVTKRAAFARNPVQRFTEDQGILFEKLIKVRDALRSVGTGARAFDIKLSDKLDLGARGKSFADQFKSLTGPGPTLLGEIPTGVNLGLETQIQKGIQAIGRESAAIKEVGFDFQKMQDIAVEASTGIITNIGGISPALQKVEGAIQGVIQKLIKLNAEAAKKNELAAFAASAPARFAAVTSKLTTAFDITRIPTISPKEQANVSSSIIDTVNAYSKLNNIDLSRFDAILAEAMGSATTLLKGNERVLFDFIRKNVEAFSQAGVSSQKYIDGLRRLSAANAQIKSLTDINLGIPFINAAVDIKKATQLSLNYSDQLQRIAAKTIAVGEKRQLPVSPTEQQTIIDAAKIGTSAIKLLDVELRGLARAYQRLIQLQSEFGVAGQTATERVRKETEKLTRETNKKAAQAVTQAALPGVFGNVQAATEKSLGSISDFARAGDRQRVETQISNISTAIAQGKISIQDYIRTLDDIKNKKITPPNANQDLNQLKDNTYGLVTAMQTAADRGNNFHKTIISLTNGLRLLVVSELYVFFSQIRSIISQTTASTIDLSIQISRIQAITQDAISPTQEWAQALREVSDASGQPILDVTAASYAAISNQITKAKDDTKAFLDVATELGRTVGSTPLESVNLLSATINAFGKNASDARQLAAEFFKTVDIGKITVADLQNILGRAGIAGAKLGVTTTEFNAALAVLTQNGLTTEDAVTRLNNLFVKLINPTKEMTTLFKNFGTTPEQLIRINGFSGALQQIESAIKNGNAAIEDLFPEIRTLVGFLGLSGDNAVKFSDAIDKITNSLNEYNKASEITSSKQTFGQNLKEELERLKNIAIVDFGQPFLKFVADANTAIGGLAERVKDLADILRVLFDSAKAAFLTMVGYRLLVPVINGVTGALAALNLATKTSIESAALLSKAFLLNPIVLGIAGVAAGFFGTLKIIETLRERATKAFDDIRKAGEVKFNESGLKSNIESSVSKSIDTFKGFSGSFSKEFNIAFARINIGYNKTIDLMKAKTVELTTEVKSAFDSLDHILTRTLSSMQNVERDARKATRDSRIKQDERNEDTILRQLEGNRALLDAADQVAGVSGPGGAQFANIEQQVKALGTTEARLREERRKAFLETYDVSAAEAAHDKLIDILDKEKRKFEEIGHAAALSRISDPNSQSGGIATAANQRATEIAGLIDQANAERDQLSEQRAALIKAEEPVVLALKDRYAALSKTIIDFDLSKLQNLQPITNKTGKVIETVSSQIEKILQPLKTAGEEIFKDFGKITPQIKRAGFFDDYQTDINNLKKQLTNLGQQRFDLGLKFGDLNQFTKDSKTVNEAIKNAQATVDSYRDSINALNKSLSETFGRIAQQVSKLPGEEERGKLGTTGLRRLLRNQTLQGPTEDFIDSIEAIKNKAKEPLTKDNLESYKIGIQDAIVQLDILEKEIKKVQGIGKFDADLKKVGGLDTLKEQLTTLKDEIDRVGFDTKGVDNFNNKIDSLSTKIIELQGNVQNNISNILTQNESDFQKFETNTLNFHKSILSQVKDVQREIQNTISQLNALSLPKAASLVSPTSPIGTATPGTVEPAKVEINSVQFDKFIEAVNSLKPPAGTPVVPVQKTTGGLINYYANGVFVPKGTDTIPAMLTPGEYIMPADKTKKYKNVLDNMRMGYYAEGGEALTMGARKESSLLGSANESLKKLFEFFLSQNKIAVERLVNDLHGHEVRNKITDIARDKGYPDNYKNPTESSKKLFNESYNDKLPKIISGRDSFYDIDKNTITLGRDTGVNLDTLVTLTHELEHAKQGKRIGDFNLNPISHSASEEIPASIGDIVRTAKLFKEEMRKPLNSQVEMASNITHDSAWMANQAEKHGYFAGKSMTDILATPSGQAYLKSLLLDTSGKEYLVRYREKEQESIKEIYEKYLSSTIQSAGFQEGGIVPKYYQEGGQTDTQITDMLLKYWNDQKNKNLKGEASEAAIKLQKFLATAPNEAKDLVEFLHGSDSQIRKNVAIDAKQQGYPVGKITQASMNTIGKLWQGETPTVKQNSEKSDYMYNQNIINLESWSKDNLQASLDVLGNLAHELEHVKQDPTKIPYGETFRPAMEIPASLGDIVTMSKIFKEHMKKPLKGETQVNLSRDFTNIDWMTRQAEKYGYFNGKSMTELLATPSGQAYLKRLLTPIPISKEKGGLIDYYATGAFPTKGTDTVPAMLTPGEYVMPVKQTNIYKKQLDAMRQEKFNPSIGLGGGPSHSFILGKNVSSTLSKYDAILKSVGIPSIEEEMKKALNYSFESGSGSGGSSMSFMAGGGIAPSFNSQVYSMGRSLTPKYYAEGGYVTTNTNSNTNTFNINVTGDSGNAENMGRKIGQAIQREVRRGNVKLS